MAQDQIKTLKIMYNDQLEYIDCPKNANYEECIEIVLERFEIPSKFKKSIQISNDNNEIFEKQTFEYYNLLFPNPAVIFVLTIEEKEIKNQHSKVEKRNPLTKLSNKRKHRDENLGVPVTRQNCFLGSLLDIGTTTDSSEEPMSKKQKAILSETKELGVLRKTISRRFIRI